MEVPLLDQLVESEAMVIETSLLGVGHIEGGPWTAAKSMDNITLKHEAGVRRPFADLILVLFRPAPRCFDARLGYGPERSSDEPTDIRRGFLRVGYSALSFSNSVCTCHHSQHLLQAQLIKQHFPFSSPHARLARH
jgi:hypothetical protein